MATPSRHGRLALLIAAGILCMGCNVLQLPFFFLTGADHKLPPKLIELASQPKQKDKDLKVVIVAYSELETKPEFVQVEHEISGLLALELQKSFKENKDKVDVVPPGQVKRYKDTHPDWKLDLVETGKHFDADYLIYLSIESLSLYEKGSHNTLYRGRTALSVSVINVHKPDDSPLSDHFECEFPRSHEISADERSPVAFRQAFLNHIAKQLSWYFTPHPVRDDFSCD